MADRVSFPFFEQEGPNPQSTLESFDAIYYAALQVIIVAGANGVSGLPIYHHTYLRCSVNQYHDFFFFAVVPTDVFHDRRRILRLVSLLHCRHHRAQFLAN